MASGQWPEKRGFIRFACLGRPFLMHVEGKKKFTAERAEAQRKIAQSSSMLSTKAFLFINIES